MNEERELLTYVHHNAQMGVRTIEHILPMTADEELKAHLKQQRDAYQTFERDAQDMMTRLGLPDEGLSAMDKARTYMGVEMGMMTDRSASHIAEMLIQGSNMGILDVAKRLREYPGADEEALNLTRKLGHFEEENIEKLKAFLG